MSQQPSGGGLVGQLFGQASRSSLLKGALTVGLHPPSSPMPEIREIHTTTDQSHSDHGTAAKPGALKPATQLQVGHSPHQLSRSPSVNPTEMQTCTPADVFSYYDQDSDGLLNKTEFARAIRACGGCPSEKQVNQWFKELAEDQEMATVLSTEKQDTKNRHAIRLVTPQAATRHGINQKTFAEEIPRLIHNSPGPSRSDILESLKTFTVQKDNQPGFILETETIRTVLGGMGPEHLDPKEVDAVLQGLEHKTGQIHFGSMLDRLSQRAGNPTLAAPGGKRPPHGGGHGHGGGHAGTHNKGHGTGPRRSLGRR
jgi:Ca2+-binding EF-hand superfamily protein